MHPLAADRRACGHSHVSIPPLLKSGDSTSRSGSFGGRLPLQDKLSCLLEARLRTWLRRLGSLAHISGYRTDAIDYGSHNCRLSLKRMIKPLN